MKHKNDRGKGRNEACPSDALGKVTNAAMYKNLTSKKAMTEEIFRRKINTESKAKTLKWDPKDLVDALMQDDAAKKDGGGENLSEENHDMEMGALCSQHGDLEVEEEDTFDGPKDIEVVDGPAVEDDLAVEILEELCGQEE